MPRRYNGLNSLDVELAKCGICEQCGRRFTDPLCTHATPDQIEYTRQLDARWDAEERARQEKLHGHVELDTDPIARAQSDAIQSRMERNWDSIPEIEL